MQYRQALPPRTPKYPHERNAARRRRGRAGLIPITQLAFSSDSLYRSASARSSSVMRSN